jgi:DNA invertase Pin-like site-specific DNA recombinase
MPRAAAELVLKLVVKLLADSDDADEQRVATRWARSILPAKPMGRFDVLGAWAVDRLGRSLQDLVATLGELRAAGVDLFLHQQAVDTTTPSGRAMFQMLGVFGEFERAMIQERVKAGLARARANGRRLGRPKSRRTRRASGGRSRRA